MKLNELKKAKPATMKSSGTDDPKKYVGGWEAYDKPQGINDRQDRKVLAKEDAQNIPLNDQTLAMMKQFLFKKWNERWKERVGADAADKTHMAGSCKFVSLFVQQIFGGEIRGSWEHQYNFIDGNIIDLNHEEPDVVTMDDPTKHDPNFLRNREYKSSIKSCMPRVNQWVEEFVSAYHLNEDVQQWNGKSVVWSGEGCHIAVDDPQDAGFITAWTDDNQKIGELSASRSRNKRGWVEVNSVDVDKSFRRNRVALRMYQALSQYMGQQYQGILGYRPDIADPAKIEPIYKRLGGGVDPENEDILLAPRKAFFEDVENRFIPDPEEIEYTVSDDDKKAIKASAKPAKGQVRMNVKALSARGKPAKLNPYRLDETVRTVVNGTLNAEYEIISEDEESIGFAAVRQGVIENLDYDTDAKQDYRGHILSALLSQIVTEADLNRANLAIAVNGMTGEVKTLLERFGFRRTGGMVMKRNHGAVRPTSVTAPQGMVNRPD